jgi:hypothetical protein
MVLATTAVAFLIFDYEEGRLAQLVRAAALHAVGLGFESLIAHPETRSTSPFIA